MKFRNTEVFNFEGAFRGLRNPLESWDRSDSYHSLNDEGTDFVYILGEKDLDLAVKLINGGTEHRKFLRQILVSVDITAPLYWWKEFDTYKVGTVANSTSTMHKIMSKEFSLDMFEVDFTNLPSDLNVDIFADAWLSNLDYLNRLRNTYLALKDTQPTLAKWYWKELIRLLPSAWLQTRTITMNYENLLSMYYHRRNHKLTEWHDYCAWIESLPYTQKLFGIG